MSKKQTGVVLFQGEATVNKGIQVLEAKLAAIQTITGSNFKTGKVVPEGFPNAVQEETKLENLNMLHGYLTSKEKAYNNSQEILGIKSLPAFNEGGHSVEDFVHDIKLRVAIIESEGERIRIEGLLEKAKGLMSQKDKLDNLFTEIAAAVS